MPDKFRCRSCQYVFAAERTYEVTTIECPRCEEPMRVPAKDKPMRVLLAELVDAQKEQVELLTKQGERVRNMNQVATVSLMIQLGAAFLLMLLVARLGGC